MINKLFYKTAIQTYHHPIQNVSKRLTLDHHWCHRIDWRHHHNVDHLIHQSLFISTRHTIMTSFIVDCTLSVTSLALGVAMAPRDDSNHYQHHSPSSTTSKHHSTLYSAMESSQIFIPFKTQSSNSSNHHDNVMKRLPHHSSANAILSPYQSP